jgi:hypothetical protein
MRKHLLLTALILAGAGCTQVSVPVAQVPSPAQPIVDSRCASYAPEIQSILAKAAVDVPDVTTTMSGLIYSPAEKTCVYLNYVERKADAGAAGTWSFMDQGNGGRLMVSFYFDDRMGIPVLSKAAIQPRVENFQKILTTGSTAEIQAVIDDREKELAPNK